MLAEQAVTTGKLGPLALKRIEILPPMRLMIALVMKCGEIRSRPRLWATWDSVQIEFNPPIPEVTNVPNRYGSTDSGDNPALAYASLAAIMPKTMTRSSLLALRSSRYLVVSSCFTSAAIFTLLMLVSNKVIGAIPLIPLSMLVHMVDTSFPTGVTAPRPVTTTLFFMLLAPY